MDKKVRTEIRETLEWLMKRIDEIEEPDPEYWLTDRLREYYLTEVKSYILMIDVWPMKKMTKKDIDRLCGRGEI